MIFVTCNKTARLCGLSPLHATKIARRSYVQQKSSMLNFVASQKFIDCGQNCLSQRQLSEICLTKSLPQTSDFCWSEMRFSLQHHVTILLHDDEVASCGECPIIQETPLFLFLV
jgi:hypothetical protein